MQPGDIDINMTPSQEKTLKYHQSYPKRGNKMADYLPNPQGLFDAETKTFTPREQCIPACQECDKMFSDHDIGDVCIAYINPKAIWRKGNCALSSHKVIEDTGPKKFINPIKSSKRGRR